ncbi:uncharacterized protein EMH_0098590 [Eimeria mitis]|uniref:Dynein heavy chain C-terminal domain-containing protein n=1 Tax=Eimeria mitis TaxID=44415 RepID=U6KC54_9EIME|nr:uncharacterized protein EMH_0098590 [Eimeria mitis]CDJ35605.1 hypothetical protein, conserved [Eimeria mitis]
MQQLLMRVQQQQAATPSSGHTASAGGNNSEFTERAASLMGQLPPLFDVEEVISSRVNPYEDAMDAALLQELARYNALITVMRKSLQIVQDAADGVIECTPEVEEMYQCLRQNRVPQAVAAASYPMSFGLAAWMANLRRRVDFMALWLRGKPPHPFWLPGCFSPRSVCKAMLQQYARRQSLKIDSVGFTFYVLENEEGTASADASASDQENGSGSTRGFAHDVSGLFLHGASWSAEEKVRIFLENQAYHERSVLQIFKKHLLSVTLEPQVEHFHGDVIRANVPVMDFSLGTY